MKLCSCCKIEKEEAEFNTKRNGLQPYCKLCQRAKARLQYAQNTDRQKKKIYANKVLRRKKAQEHLLGLFKKGCCDCGITDPEVLEWDHVSGEKEHNVSSMLADGYSIKKLNMELAKCDLVCANCHRKRTFARHKTYRTID